MKKLFSLILALCMVCMLVPAVAEEDVTGEWYLKTMKQGETEYDAGAINYNITMTLNADGTGTMLSPTSEEPTPGSWTLEGDKITVTFEDSPIGGTVADGKITLSEGEISMVFTREKPEGIKVADVNPAAAAEDFEGTWEIAYVGYNGMIIDPSTTGQEMPGLVVENGAMKFTGNSSMSQAFGTNAIPLTFADGALGMSVSMGETSYGIKLEMLEDGMLALTANMGSTEVYMYFVKAAAEEPAA